MMEMLKSREQIPSKSILSGTAPSQANPTWARTAMMSFASWSRQSTSSKWVGRQSYLLLERLSMRPFQSRDGEKVRHEMMHNPFFPLSNHGTPDFSLQWIRDPSSRFEVSPLHGALTDSFQTAKPDVLQVFYPSTNDVNSVLSFDEDCFLATL
jgi:hypothetical protein